MTHILLVDENPTQARISSRILEQENLTVTVAATLQDGVRVAVEGHFDLIITDLVLPGGSGIELCRQIREARGNGTPVIVRTSRGTPTNVLEGLSAGVASYMARDLSPAEMIARIRNVLAVQPDPEAEGARSFTAEFAVLRRGTDRSIR
ncbi:MAG: response regulator transcription factor, partial [Planctomycetota bacterium]|nr:response regulator transcription factor [Planctomycetota bacterium]